MNITEITSRQILDSRGRPTLETTVHLDTGTSGTAAVPSGASTGTHEALELRDGRSKRYGGLGVQAAIKNVTGPIAKALKGQDIRELRAIDQRLIQLDGTVNKSKLGANAILSVSLAAARAAAGLEHLPLYRLIQKVFDFPAVKADKLPRPMMNVLNGGRHADTELKIQECLILPNGKTTGDQVERGVMVYRALGELLAAKHLRTTVGDEGGFAPAIKDPSVALDFLMKAISAAGYQAPRDVGIGLDLAASEFYSATTERYAIGETKGGLTADGMVALISEWTKRFPIQTLEDPLAEDDWNGWQILTQKLGKQQTIIGDDLFVTNVHRLQRGIDSQVANAILIKPNQVGTLSETIDAIQAARAAKYQVIVSHRSGETSDDFISDLAVGVGADWLKAGAPARGERVAKYNRLLAIADELAA
jgi:enolase